MDVDPNYDPSDFLQLPGSRQDNHDIGLVKQEHHQEMQQYEMQQEELQQHEYEHQEYQQQDYQQTDGVNIEVVAVFTHFLYYDGRWIRSLFLKLLLFATVNDK